MKIKSIKSKMILMYIPVGLLPLLVVSYILISMYQKTYIRTSQSQLYDNLNFITVQLEYYIKDIEMCANMTAVNISELENKPVDSSDKIRESREILKCISKYNILFPWVEDIYFIDRNGVVHSTNPKKHKIKQDKLQIDPFIHRLYTTQGQHIWGTEGSNILLGKKVIHIDSGKTLGYILLNIKEETLSNIYYHKNQRDIQYQILSAENQIISSRKKELLGTMSKNYEIKDGQLYRKVNSDNDLVFYKEVVNGWYLLGEMSKDNFNRELQRAKNVMVSIGAGCIIMSILASQLMTRWIVAPINRLKEQVENIGQGDLKTPIKIESMDEVGIFARALDQMRIKVKELMCKVEQEQKQKREYELALLREQVKPHFLYNALDAIYILCSMKQHRRAKNMTKSLADFYRYSLSKGKDIITIDEELSCVKHYLEIQKHRYNETFNYSITCQDLALADQVPKLILQPIVENALYHGIKEKEGIGHISINCVKTCEGSKITIRDDGVGMDNKKIEEILHKQSGRFGLKGLIERLELYGKDLCSIDIVSQVGEYTEVIIEISRELGSSTNH